MNNISHLFSSKRVTGRGGRRLRATALAAAAIFASSALGEAIVASNFARTINITFPGYTGSTTLSDFPALVKLSAANGFDYSKCAADGSDLRFALEDGTLLAHEIDTWDTAGTSLVWVKVPSFNADAVITAYYGCENPPDNYPTNVWSVDFVGVWHMQESDVPLAESSGVSGSITTDSTGGRAAYGYAGAIGSAVDLSKTSWGHYLSTADNGAFDGFTNFTLEMWTKQNSWRSGTYNSALMAKRESGELSYFWYLNRADNLDGPDAMLLSTNGTETIYLTGNRKKPEADAWTHQAFVRNTAANQCLMYIGTNTFSVGSQGTEKIFAGSGPLYIGGWTGAAGFPGQIDEVRISRVARSADWIKATRDCVTVDGFAEYEPINLNASWDDYAMKFAVTFPGATNGVVENFPVLVKVSESGIDGFKYSDCLLADGKDLRFADENGNLLASEVDTWDINGVSYVWVSVPSLTTAIKITGYYGNSAPHSVTASDVWTNGFNAVWHLGESAAPLAESTGNATPFREATVAPLYAATGAIGKAVDFTNNSSTSSRLSAADDDDLDGFEDFTVEFWSYQESFLSGQFAGILAKRNYASNQEAWFFYQNNTTTQNPKFVITKDSSSRLTATTPLPPTRQWVHQAYSRKMSSGHVSVYYDGTSVYGKDESGASAKVPVLAGTAPLYLGGGTSQNSFPGSIDEVRISSVVRDAAWLKTTHECVTDLAFASYGRAKGNKDKATVVIFK